MANRDRRNKRVSTARRRAETHSAGYTSTCVKLPEGMKFYNPKPGVHKIDIVSFIAKDGNPCADAGEEHFERTYYNYRSVGIDEKSYVCSSKTFGKRDYIQEVRAAEAKKTEPDMDLLKSLEPKERQLFLVYDHEEEEAGLKLWEISYHNFGKLLDSRIKTSNEDDGWDLFYLNDEDGMTLRITVSEEKMGKVNFNKITAIDFLPRKEGLPAKIADHGLTPDDMIVETPYEELKKIYLGADYHKSEEVEDTDETDDEDESEPEPEKPKKVEKKEEKEKEEAEEEPKKKEKTQPRFEKDQTVLYNDKICTIVRFNEEGDLCMLMDDETEDILKHVEVKYLKPYVKETKKKEESKDEEPKAEKEEKKPTKKRKPDSDDDEGDWDWDEE